MAALVAQEQARLAALAALDGVAKWQAMLDLGTIRQQIAEQQKLLAECEKQHAEDITAEVVVFDLPANSGPNRIARTWQLTPTGQAVKQTTTVADGKASFPTILRSSLQSFGITIEQTDQTGVNGPDFRSGPLPSTVQENVPDPLSRIEIVILEPIVLTGDLLSQAPQPLPITLSLPGGTIGDVSISVTSLQVQTQNGEILLTATGTASTQAKWPLVSPVNSPFTFSQRLHISPSFGMAPSVILEATAGTSPLLVIPGLVGSIVQFLTPLLASNLLDRTVQPLALLLNQVLMNRVTSSLGIAALPSGAMLSIRQLTADGDSLTVTPVLGCFGTVLSTFQPGAQTPTVQLAGLDVDPKSFSTSTTGQNIAMGTVTLDSPAPDAGVNVLLSCDRPDIISLQSAPVFFAAGEARKSFAIRSVEQRVQRTDYIDVTVRASLGTQTLEVTVTVRPESPTTVITPQAVPVAPAVTSTPQISEITLRETPPLHPDMTVGIGIFLDRPADTTLTGVLTFSGEAGQYSFTIDPGTDHRYFATYLPKAFVPASLVITAALDNGSRKEVTVPVVAF
jgi:hypothetical protein